MLCHWITLPLFVELVSLDMLPLFAVGKLPCFAVGIVLPLFVELLRVAEEGIESVP
jgi:hypothetical protein